MSKPLHRFISALVLLAPLAASSAHADPRDDADLVLLDGGMAQVTLIGLLQLQATPLLGDDARLANGDPGDAAGFRIHRARFGLKTYMWGNTEFALSVQASTRSFNILDAYVAYRDINFLNIVVGSRISPFSRFAQLDAHRGSLADLPFATRAMAPFRQVGVTFEGEIGNGLLKYAVGAYNGILRGEDFIRGYEQTPALEGNRFTSLSVVGRAELAPLGATGTTLVDFERDKLRIGVGGSFLFDPGETVETLAWGVDLVLKVRGFHFGFEFLADSAEPSSTPTVPSPIPSAVDRTAMVGELGYLIWEDILGLTARVEWLDDNTALDNAGDQLIVTAGLQYYLHRHHLKAQLEYTHRTELHGISLDNDALMLQVQTSL